MTTAHIEFIWEVATDARFCWVELAEVPEVEDLSGPREDTGPGEASLFVDARVLDEREAEALAQTESHRLYLVAAPRSPEARADPTARLHAIGDHSGLFRNFAETEPTLEGIVDFARRYGLLEDLDDTDTWLGDLRVPKLHGGAPVHGEQFLMWQGAILSMAEGLRLWDLAIARDTQGLHRYLRWNDGLLAFWSEAGHTGEGFMVLYNARTAEGPIAWDESDLLGPARYVAAGIVNRGLEERATPGLVTDSATLRQHLALVPRDLLGALWLQFANAIEAEPEYRKCEHCGTWFEVGPGAASRARRFCSNRCRVAASRRKLRDKLGGKR